MKAFVHQSYGPPEVLQLKDVPEPVLDEKEVLIKVQATTVNRTDDGLMRALPFFARFFTGLFRPQNEILGSEFSGVVTATGSQVALFEQGDRVFGFSEFGAHAEYLNMPEEGSLATIPGDMTYEEAAPLTEGAHYALNYIRAANIQPGQKVLVYGATGAIGSAAVQIIKALDCEVTAVCDAANMELVKSLGADEVIDYTAQDFTKIGKTFHVVLDAVGKSTYRKCKPLIKQNGIFMATDLGFMAQNPLLSIFSRKVLFPIPEINKEVINYIKGLAEAGKFKPVIDRQYHFEQIPEAFRYVHKGQKVGNVVITYAHNGTS